MAGRPKKETAAKRYEAKRAGSRTRNWAFIMYPDSAPENWKEIFNELHIQAAVSPLHDRDENPNGEIKKAHWHVVLCFENNKTENQVREISKMVNGTEVKMVQSLVGMLRYLTHRDNPEKAQYDDKDIITFGGLDVAKIILTSSDKVLMLEEIFDWIDKERCTKFTTLMRYCRVCRRDWFEMLATGFTIVVQAYLKDMWREEHEVD